MHVVFRFLWVFLPLFLCANEPIKKKEKILRINFLEGAPKFIHPHLSRDTNGRTLCKALFEGLTRINNKGKVELAIAEKIEISKCRTKYIIHMRPSKWANGKELTSSHFVEAWKSAIKQGTGCLQPYHFFVIKNAEKVFLGKIPVEKLGIYAPKKDQIVIHLEHPAPYFTQLLADPIYSPLFDISKMNSTNFNGPFLLKNFKISKEISLIKNLLYWDQQTVQLDGAVISLVQDAVTAYELYIKGKLDFVGSPLTDLPEEIIRNISDQIQSKKVCALHWLHINTTHPKLRSKNIRKALSLSINREHIAQYILPNAIANHYIIPQEISSLDGQTFQKNSEQIQELFAKGLQELGYEKKDFYLTLNCSTIPRHFRLAEYLKNQWEKTFGIKVLLDKTDWNTFFAKLCSGNFCLGGTTKYTSYEDPLYFLEYFYDRKNNYSRWENSKYQKLIDLANWAISDNLRKKYLAKAEKVLQEECPVIPVYTHKHLYLCNPSLQEFYPSRLAYTDFKWAYFE